MRGSYRGKRTKEFSVFMYLMLAGASDGVECFGGGPLDSDVIRAPRDVLVTPFNHQDVLSFLL